MAAAGAAAGAARQALAAIDWTAPWLQDWRTPGQGVAARVEQGATVAEALNASKVYDAPRRFVAQSGLPPGVAYEQHIFDTGSVPTREGLHDFFNGLVWLQFPQSKARLNALHVAQIAHTGIQPVRGPARDALTLLDENGALLHAPDALWNALLAKDWQRLFMTLRPLWQQARLVLFGHALTEKLVTPRKPITAHVLRVLCAGQTLLEMDCWLAGQLSPAWLARKPFAHLPVLGVPGWWPGNADADFYADRAVFRAASAPKSTAKAVTA